MSILELEKILSSLQPKLIDGLYVFVSLPTATCGQQAKLEPFATVSEAEGLTLVIPKSNADRMNLQYDGGFRIITLDVFSDLHSVGLTAAIAGTLSTAGIAANILAGYHHDHILVPNDQAETALKLLLGLSKSNRQD